MRLLKQAATFGVLILGLALIAAVFVPPVHAQDFAIVPAQESTLIQQIVLALVPAIGVVITALVGWGVALLKAKTGIDIEARHREALQSALTNGILWAIQKAGWMPGQPVTDQLLTYGRSYVESSVPDALKQFGIDPVTSAGKAALDRLLTPKLPVPPGTVMPNGDVLVGRVK